MTSLLLFQTCPAATPHCINLVPLTISYTKNEFSGEVLCLNTKDAIADSGAMQFFMMEGTPVISRCTMMHPLKVAPADGRMVMSTHMCDIYIKGLPMVLTGHFIPNLSITSLFGIRVLINPGCTVTFDKECCTMRYNGNIILSGKKDPSTDLLTLPMGLNQGKNSFPVGTVIPPATPVYAKAHANMTSQIAFFLAIKPTAFVLHINHCAAPRFPPFSK
jgi:hypothetical protein